MPFRLYRLQLVMLATLAGGAAASAQVGSAASAPLAAAADPQIAAALRNISAEQVQADITKLVSFGTRSTLSSMDADLPAAHGLLPAAAWVESEYRAISATCGGCLEVKRDEFVEEPAAEGKPKNRYARETKMVNVYAILHGVFCR